MYTRTIEVGLTPMFLDGRCCSCLEVSLMLHTLHGTGVGKSPISGILNISFTYLLDIISPIVGWCEKWGHLPIHFSLFFWAYTTCSIMFPISVAIYLGLICLTGVWLKPPRRSFPSQTLALFCYVLLPWGLGLQVWIYHHNHKGVMIVNFWRLSRWFNVMLYDISIYIRRFNVNLSFFDSLSGVRNRCWLMIDKSGILSNINCGLSSYIIAHRIHVWYIC